MTNNTGTMSHANAAGIRQAALILLVLEEEAAAEVLKHFPANMIQKISKEMSKLNGITQAEIESVLNNFHNDFSQTPSLDKNDDYVRSVLTKALGEDRANTLIEDILEHKVGGAGMDALNLMEVSEVAEMIKDEHPQIIATILIHLDRAQAAGVLELFEERLRNDVVLRVASFSGVQPAALQELTEVLGGMLDGQSLKRSKMGGVRTAAEILNLLSAGHEDTALENIRAFNDELAQKIIDEMFLFENLLDLDDRSIQVLMRQIETPSLVVALKGAPAELVDKFLKNMSQRAAQMLRDDMETRGPTRVSQVESEQKAILQVVRKLADSGEIVLSSGEDAYI
ncbi:Flagellar motor switch protein FliG [Pseudidiomarina piscicola]|uniref:Flagellar motor switch protein FliG n=1 Tax=Pseudidiomarina piscicola TaxID=2614830 RepID=A0A6S6WM11_9GAMM|nr:flagellar motor switch protein FliG [Pseudidiomarina piscicola]CAB0151054.1 Flagellar motor switch protein FliG [Pseudidiomarina piscicola]VZT40564.1 Flagellar motor switch protein FliG [Pseudomonas aeruginosa]